MKEYFVRDKLSEKVLRWKFSGSAKLPSDIWREAYEVDCNQGLKWEHRFRGVDIEEPVQDVAVDTPRITNDYRGGARFSTVIIAALKFSALEYIRKRKIQRLHKPHIAEYFERRTRNRTQDVVEQVQYNELKEIIQTALDKLPEHERSILEFTINRIHYADIASMYDTSIDGVRSRLYRARQHFREALEASAAGREYLNESVPARYGVKRRRAIREYKNFPRASR